MDKLSEYRGFIDKMFGKNSGILVTDPSSIVIEKFPTGSYLLDRDLKGGWAKGTMIEIFGAESSGKTSTAIHAVAEHQKKYPDEPILWVDLEKVFDPTYFETIGINIKDPNFILTRPSSGEDVWEIMIEFCKKFQNGVVVLDSVTLLLPKKEDEALMTESSFAQGARLNSIGLRKLFPYIKFGGTTFFMINQVRTDIGSYGDSDKSTGGNGWKFYARTRIKTTKSKGEAGEYAVHKFRQVKSNYGTPDVITETTIEYGRGFDSTRELLRVAVDEGIVTKGGSWYSYGDTRLGQGEDNVVDLLNDNPELFQELLSKLKEKGTL